MKTFQQLSEANLITPPKWLPSNIHYEGIAGSYSYGVSADTSDVDIVGICIPPKHQLFPHLNGEILGFGRQIQRFEEFQQHHIIDDEQSYDIKIYNIVKFFQLAMDNNPNIIDILFLPTRCVTRITKVGEIIRKNRRLFLHKGSYYKFRGYAFSQLAKIDNNNPVGKRRELFDKYGYDTKYAYHLVRLILEVEDILTNEDLDIERNATILIQVRNGQRTLAEIKEFFYAKEKHLDDLYEKSTLRDQPDEDGKIGRAHV